MYYVNSVGGITMQNYSNMPYMPYTSPCRMMQNQYMMPQTMPDMMMQGQYQIPQAPQSILGLEQYTYPQNFPEALKIIQEAVAGETEDKLFYQYLIENAPAAEDKEIIAGIRDDEISHFNLFRQVYFQLTGQTLPLPQNVTFEKPASYCEGIKRAVKGEQNAVKKYRRILFALQDRVQINILTGIITDEIRHGILYNYLFSKNGCR
jgi:rubrerythrin